MSFSLRFYIFITLFTKCVCEDDFCYADSNCGSNQGVEARFLLYDVNPSEGFNLRRDVYMRFAILAHKMKFSQKLDNFKLVLPPWSYLVHWKQKPTPEYIPWGLFFDLDSLRSFAGVIEMYEFFTAINQTSKLLIDEVYILQHFEDMFETGKFEDRMEIAKCQKNYHLNYFYYKNLTSLNVKCLSYHGPATKLQEILKKSSAKIILLHHAEVALHEMFGNQLYWKCRRSMRFNKELRNVAVDFRRNFLNSSDQLDNTVLPGKWELEQPKRTARGGPYLSVHLRRQDFLRGRSHQIPSLDDLAEQIINFLESLQLRNVFIATDASAEEYEQLVKKIPSKYKTFKFIPRNEIKVKFGDGGVAIIDQIICSYARFFVGTYESTFSFRIQEEREILGFPIKTSFNSFCGKDKECQQPSEWKIVY